MSSVQELAKKFERGEVQGVSDRTAAAKAGGEQQQSQEAVKQRVKTYEGTAQAAATTDKEAAAESREEEAEADVAAMAQTVTPPATPEVCAADAAEEPQQPAAPAAADAEAAPARAPTLNDPAIKVLCLAAAFCCYQEGSTSVRSAVCFLGALLTCEAACGACCAKQGLSADDDDA
eukprot:Rhum_TRINITY_DN14516_c10_g2::Rhum_TRINITY_DN14516_c10_g2_i1::g.94518::m.94518